jgi:hypothetical protein
MGFGILFIRENLMMNINRRLRLIFTLFVIVTAGCFSRTPEVLSYPNTTVPTFSPAPEVPSYPNPAVPTFSSAPEVPSYPNPVVPTVSPVPTFNLSTPFSTLPWSSPTATYDPNNMPPELLFTSTPDPDALTASAELSQDLSQEEIARALFGKWLEHYQGKNMSPSTRIDEYSIVEISIPSNQKCAEKLEAEFVANAVIVLKTTMPLLSNNFLSSDWIAGSGNIMDQYHISKPFSAAIYREGNKYKIKVIPDAPMCDPS